MGVINYRIAIPRTGGSREAIITDVFDAIVETPQTFRFDGITVTVTPNYANDSIFYVKVDCVDGWLDNNNYRHEYMVVQGTEGSFTLDIKICEMFSIEEGTTLTVNRIVNGEFLFGVDFNGDNSCDGGSVTYTPASGSKYVECYIDDCCVWHIKPITDSNIPVKSTITHTAEDITSVLELNVWCWGYDTTIDFDNDYFSISTSKNTVKALCTGTLPFSNRDIGATINDAQAVGGFYNEQARWEIVGFDDLNSDVLIKASHDINTCLYPEIYKMVCEDKTLHYSISSIYPDVKITDDLITFPYGGGTRTFKIYDTEHTFADVQNKLGYSITYNGVEDDVHTFTAVSDGTSSTKPEKINIGGNNFTMYVLMYTAPNDTVVPLSGFPVLVGDDETAVEVNYTSTSALDVLDNPLGFSILTSTSSSTTLKTVEDWGIRPLFNAVKNSDFTYWIIKNGASITSEDTSIDYDCIGDDIYVRYNRCVPAGFSTTGDITLELTYTSEGFDYTYIGYEIIDIGKEWRTDTKYYLNVYTENGYSKQIELVRTAPECRFDCGEPYFKALRPETITKTLSGYNMKTINPPVLVNPWKSLTMTVGETSEDVRVYDEGWRKGRELSFTSNYYFSTQSPKTYFSVDGVGYDGKTYSALFDVDVSKAFEFPKIMGANETTPTFIPVGYYIKTPSMINESSSYRTDTYHIDDPSIISVEVRNYDASVYGLSVGETALNWFIYNRSGVYDGWSKVNFKVTDGKPSYEGPSSIEVAQYETRTVNIVLRNINYASCYISSGGNLETEQEIMGNDLFITAKISIDGNDELVINTRLYDGSTDEELTYRIPLIYVEQPSRITPETTELEVSAGYTSGSISVEYYACSTPNTPTYPSWVSLNVLSDSMSSVVTRTVVYGYEIESNATNNGVSRNGEIVFSAPQLDDGKVSAVVTITQLEDTSKMASIAIYTTDLNYAAKGGTKYVQVDYTNAATINTPSSDSWITITESSRNTVTSGLNTILQVQYKVVAASTSTSRTTNITFSCVGGDGVKVSSSRTLIYQEAPTAEITAIDKYTNFRSDGGWDFVEFVTINPDSEGLVVSTESPYITTLSVYNSETIGDITTYTVNIEGNVEYTGTTKLTQYVKVSYTTTGGDYAELLYPVYIYPATWGDIKPFNEVLELNADGTHDMSYTTLGCGYSSMSVIDTPISDADWFTVTGEYTTDSGSSTYDETRRWAYTVTPNDGDERRCYVSYTGIDTNGNTITAISTVLQAKADDYEEPSDPDTPDLPSNSYDTTVAPIWKDCEYIWASQESVVFTLSTEIAERSDFGVEYIEKIIYKGKAWRKPDDDRIRVLINKICQNYFDDAYLPLNKAAGVNGGYRKFYLKSEAGTLLHTYYFVNDWSYKTLKLGLKTNPIIPNIVDGQRLFFSSFAHDEQMGFEWGMTYYNGTPNYTNTEIVKNSLFTLIVPPSRSEGAKSFSFGNRNYQMIPRCTARYVLYYLNPYGGWDWFPIMGTVKRTDNLTQYSYTRNYNNTTLDFGKTRYLSEINVRYAMNTGWLSQAQSDRMWELMESNSVYMHDLTTDEIRPMVITDTQVEHKQKNRSQKIIQYTINIEESQTRERM